MLTLCNIQKSPEYLSLMRKFDQPGIGRPALDRLSKIQFQAKQASSSRTQLWLLTRRLFTTYWRTPSYNLTRLVIALGLGVVFGLLLVGEDFGSYQGINAAVGVILMTTLYQGNISFNSVLPFTARERAAYDRERNSQTYGAVWYFVGSILFEIPYALAIGLVFFAVFYPVVGVPSILTVYSTGSACHSSCFWRRFWASFSCIPCQPSSWQRSQVCCLIPSSCCSLGSIPRRLDSRSVQVVLLHLSSQIRALSSGCTPVW